VKPAGRFLINGGPDWLSQRQNPLHGRLWRREYLGEALLVSGILWHL